MKITTTKIQKILIKEHGWNELYLKEDMCPILISDTIKVIDKILREQKNISIR